MKDHDHTRTKCSVGSINIISEKLCPVSKTKFLSNVQNKTNFVNFLACELQENEIIECVSASDDCDTLIVKTALGKAS